MESIEAIVQQLERAANIVLAPPNLVSNEERLQAQNIIQGFKDQRQRQDIFAICNLILDKCRNELVLHETAQVLRSVLQLRWGDIPPSDIDALCEKLVRFIFHSPELSYGIHRSLSTVVALIVKRDRVLRQGKKCVELVQFLETLLHGTTLSPACAIFDALISEHQFVANNDDPVLSFDVHTMAKRDFEMTSFLRIFQLCLSFLNTFNNEAGDNAAFIQANSKALGLILDLLESVFSWNFATLTLTKRLAAIIERDTAARWKPPVSWKETILSPSCFQIIFQTYSKLRFSEAFLSKLVTVVTQFISVYGPVLHSEGYYGTAGSSSLDFLNQALPNLITIIELPNKSPNEVLGLSDILRKLVIYHRPAVLASAVDGLYEKYLKAAAEFSYFIIQQGVTEEANCSIEDRMYRDATTRILDMWTTTISDVDAVSRETLEPIAKNLFNYYLLGRLSPPEGTRVPSTNDTEEVIDDEEQSDETQFRDQLEIIGFIGRYVVSHSVPFMNSLLTFKIQAFQKLIEQGAAAQGPAGKDFLISLYEDLHWTVLVAGELISYEALGEISLIPPEVNQLCVEAAASSAASNAAFQNAVQLQPIAETVDPVMRLVYQVITLLEMEARLIESNLGFLLSPIVAQNILWFLNRWASIYFIFSEDRYASISESFSTGWGEDSPIVGEIQTLLFHRIRLHLVSFVGEDGVTAEAINLIDSLVSSQKKAKMALASPALSPLVDLLNQVGANSQRSPMSNLRYQKFVGALTEIGTHCIEPEERRNYFARVIGPILTRFQNLSQVINSGGDKHRDDIRQELISIFNGMIGVALSSQSKCASEIFALLSVAAKQCGSILSTFNNYNDIVDLCLEFITQLGKQSLSYLPKAESYCLYECAMNVVKAYAHHATGRHSREQTADEDSYNDLLMLMEMLFCLLTKDLLDFSSVFRLVEVLSGAPPDNSEPQIHASDVCLQGLSIILPLMSADLIQYPSLSTKYFRLLAYVSELHAEKVLEVQPWMLEAIFRSIELGLQKSVPDDFCSCCEFIANVTNQVSKNQQAHPQVVALVSPFLKIFLQMLLSNSVGKDYMAPFSSTLFALISLFQDMFNELAQELIRSCSSDSKRLVLEDGFKKLTENLNLRNGGDRMSRVGFRDRLEAFVFAVSGSLN